MTPRCLYMLPVGRPDISRVKACITPGRQVRFFGSQRPREPIDCGFSACVYPAKAADRLVKLTVDPADVATMQTAGWKYASRIYNAHEIGQTTDALGKRTIYALEVERLKALPRGQRARYDAHLACAVDDTRYQRGAGQSWAAYRTTIQRASRDCCEAGAPGCIKMVADILEAREVLRARGINWFDTHAGNIGWSDRDRRWKALDLGNTGVPLTAPVPYLGGARRGNLARRRRRSTLRG